MINKYGLLIEDSDFTLIKQNSIQEYKYGIFLKNVNHSQIVENFLYYVGNCISETDCINNTIGDNVCKPITTNNKIYGYNMILFFSIGLLISVLMIILIRKEKNTELK